MPANAVGQERIEQRGVSHGYNNRNLAWNLPDGAPRWSAWTRPCICPECCHRQHYRCVVRSSIEARELV